MAYSAIATGVNTKLAYNTETVWGEKAATSGAQYLRRVSADFNLEKDTYQSEEMRTDFQTVDMRHGVRRATGSLNGEFSPGSYSDFIAAAVRKDFAVVTSPAVSMISVAVAGTVYTLSSISSTANLRVGMVIRLNGSSIPTHNGKNLLITSVINSTSITCVLVSPTVAALVAGTSTTNVTIQIIGKVTYVPSTDHTDKSFTVEQFFDDIDQSEVYTGMKVNSVGISMPATGMTTIDFGFMGKDLLETSTTQYFSAATPAGSTGIFNGANGLVMFDGVAVAVITDATVNINSDMTEAVVLGSNSIADVFEGRVLVDGSMSVYFKDATFRDAFKNETEVSLIFVLTTTDGGGSGFTSITLPRVKLNSFTKADAADGIIASCDFVALKQGTNTVGKEETTIMIHDSNT